MSTAAQKMSVVLGEVELAKARRLWQQGRLAEAERAYRRLAKQFPRLIDAQYFLGTFLAETGRYAEGAEVLRCAERLAPDSPWIKINLGTAHRLLGDEPAALCYFTAARSLGYSAPELLNNIGLLQAKAGDFTPALDVLFELTTRWPDFALGFSSLAQVLGSVGRVSEAFSACARALELAPTEAALVSAQLMTSLYVDSFHDLGLRDFHAQLSPRIVPPAADLLPLQCEFSRGGSPLNVGFVSPDLGDHAVAYFFRPLIDELDSSRFRSVLYSCSPRDDAVAQALRGRAGLWRDISQIDDANARKLIAHDRVDVLIDLAGHTRNNRLGLFARRSAPLQLSCIGYPATTGLSAVDWVLSDSTLDPPGSEAHYVERLYRLDYFCAYRPPDGAPPVTLSPQTRNGFLTLGVFHAGPKLTEANLDRWAGLLAGSPKARLLLMAKGVHDESLRKPIMAAFERAGVVPERIELREFGRLDEFLAALGEVDLCLDALPWNGHTTTCHALWMGVPTLSVAGTRRAGRMGKALLQEVGLPEFAVPDQSAAMARVDNLAADPTILPAIRASLRDRMQASRLCDGRAFARDFERCLDTLFALTSRTGRHN